MTNEIITLDGKYEVHPVSDDPNCQWSVVNGETGEERCTCSTSDEAVKSAEELNQQATNTITITSAKGDFTGTQEECVAWLEETNPSFATVQIGDYDETIPNDCEDWESGVANAIKEITDFASE